MELRHLRYFLTVAETLNFTKAAEKLFISQPPLSRQIKELENDIGAQLFTRSNKKVELTEAGKYFQEEVKEVFKTLERATLKTKKIAANENGEFRIAYISSTFSGAISQLMQYLSQEYPYVNFKLYEVPTTKQIAALEQGKIDLGILRAPIQSPKVLSTLWYKDGYSLVFNPQLTSFKEGEDFSTLQKETFVFFNKDYAPQYYNSLLQICAQYGFYPNVVHESNNINSIIQLVRSGLGVSIIPNTISRTHPFPELKYLPFKDISLHTEVLMATGKGISSKITQSAIKFLKDGKFYGN